MCKNATATAAALMAGIEPTLTAFMNLENVPAATQTQVLTAYEAAQQAVAQWTPGTSGQVAVEAVQAVNSIFQTLPVPDIDKALAGIITAGFTSVIAIIEANSTTDPVQQAGITAKAVTDVNALAPGSFKYHKGIFAVFQASPEKAYHDAWNKKVGEAASLDPKYNALKVS
jgi:hypothetical protein